MNIGQKRAVISKLGISDGLLLAVQKANNFFSSRTYENTPKLTNYYKIFIYFIYTYSAERKACKSFVVQGEKVGLLSPNVVEMLKEDPDIFTVSILYIYINLYLQRYLDKFV